MPFYKFFIAKAYHTIANILRGMRNFMGENFKSPAVWDYCPSKVCSNIITHF
jgi:hypothetical protein